MVFFRTPLTENSSSENANQEQINIKFFIKCFCLFPYDMGDIAIAIVIGNINATPEI
jgi:hypothetical protein